VSEANHPVRASYLIAGAGRPEVFAALLDVRSFTKWGYGLRQAQAVNEPGVDHRGVRPGTRFEFTLSAAGLTHEVVSAVTVVRAPERIEWRYVKGAVGTGGWTLEDAAPNAVRMTLFTDYRVKPGWLNRLAHRPFFRGLTEDLLRRSMRRFEQHLRESGGQPG
jgi:ribosome-associated toxin RatA of RatAB toxin-antitoxin module